MNSISSALIGYGRMGGFFLKELLSSDRWSVKYIFDTNEESRRLAAAEAPGVKVIDDAELIFDDPEVDVVILTALADSRPDYIRRCVQAGKHIIAEKPLGDTVENEKAVVELVSNSGLLTAVDLYLRNSWYHNTIRDFIDSGEIGDLAIIRLCHLTPGLSPGEGHDYEGPSFHDCGMHYVDLARWYARSEYKTWNAQGVRMWNWKDPWYLQGHGTFENGVVFDITQGHVYGQLSKDQTHNSYIDIIGTKGIARMTHDFKTAVVDLRGTSVTERIERPYGGKNIGTLLSHFAEALRSGRPDDRLPSFADAALASEIAWKFLESASGNDLPVKGTLEELDQIHERRWNAKDGYGLIRRRH